MAFIRALAAFEQMSDQVKTSEEYLLNVGFGDRPRFYCFLAYSGSAPAGFALLHAAFSTWRGEYLFLEDLYVHEEHRKSGIGKMLLRAAIELSARLRCARLDWQALDWNQPALTFYQHKIGAEQMREWIYHRLSAESMAAFLEAEQIRDSSDR
ncbi:unnamed protein product [Vitrella brassicaformis CCMP3155]|uniref:N-acetyltransferase domain-containing protein n=1 Tax=Vitrella brassicaformis (strain CCMP3155) TaxID=1169540 RepID=A0A0G4EC86_VITBC|nr:unnamed protein product [Vitrella brassicaformis CCMP3155]|eukprot:CEL93113.1 unnamed protein product [Vitrella brassicaformis CCMP3155]